MGDHFADRVRLMNANGIKSGNNSIATVEPGEPLHGGQPGGKSLWYTWSPPGTGIATFSTAGSGFDTLLGVYSGSNFMTLLGEAGDEDSGGFYTSERSFNVFDGFTYQIAIDGFGGASGDFLVNWSFEPTRNLLPVVAHQPVSRTVASGSNVTFTVGAFGSCREFDHDCRHVPGGGHPQHPDPQRVVSYQWFFGGGAIPGATSATLTLSNVQENTLGLYYAEVTDDTRTVRSDSISLQINETGQFVQNVQARDKFLNASQSEPLRLGAALGDSGPGFVPVQGGRTNYIVIDGVSGATGTLRLNYSLVTPALLVPLGTTPEGNSRVRVSGRPNVRFTLQRSRNLHDWSSLLTTNAVSGVFDYIDTGSASMPGRFYRALLLP